MCYERKFKSHAHKCSTLKVCSNLKATTCTKGGLAGYRLDYWTMAWNANCVSQIDFNTWKVVGLVLQLQIV